MKTIVTLLLILVLFCSKESLAQTSKQMVQLHQVPNHVTTVHLQLPSNKVRIVKTKSSRISIETTISLDAGSPPLLDYLIQSKRYELKAKSSSDSPVLLLALAPSSKVLIIKGAVCQEALTYVVYVPEHLLKVTTSYSAITASLAK
ncbi:MAG: hypothetical protein ACRBFS_06545 [Aureispira sp.]